MPLKTSLFYLPSVGTRADIEAGMAGLRGDLYQRMLQDFFVHHLLGVEPPDWNKIQRNRVL